VAHDHHNRWLSTYS
jgi:hypothetical protein